MLTYRGGELFKAVTRGNGEVGEVITNNARVFSNIPLKIAYQGELILRGEAVIGYRDFERINSEIEDVDAKYKNFLWCRQRMWISIIPGPARWSGSWSRALR